MADLDENDSTDSGAGSADPSSGGGRRAGGSHALGAESTPPAHVDPAKPDELVSDSDYPDEAGRDLLPDDSDKELVAVGAPSSVVDRASAGRDTGAMAASRSKKVKATPGQKQIAEKEHRTGPVTFLRESIGELQKVVYPTGQQLLNYFVVVLIFVLFIIAIVSLLDLAFGKAILAVFS